MTGPPSWGSFSLAGLGALAVGRSVAYYLSMVDPATSERSYRARLNLRQRVVMRVLGIKMSGDGLRWTAPRRSQRVVERAFREATLRFWTETGSAEVPEYTSTDEGVAMETPRGRVELRWSD